MTTEQQLLTDLSSVLCYQQVIQDELAPLTAQATSLPDAYINIGMAQQYMDEATRLIKLAQSQLTVHYVKSGIVCGKCGHILDDIERDVNEKYDNLEKRCNKCNYKSFREHGAK